MLLCQRGENHMNRQIKKLLFVSLLCIVCSVFGAGVRAAEESGSVGVEGRISSPPPSVGATISVPRDGQTFTELPITVAGICQNGLLVKVFKNNVFAGSAQCNNGSFSIVIDLFSGLNELVARVYDDLDQAGPDSNLVRVTFNDSRPGAASRVSLTSNFAKRGANPGQPLTWPIILAGGEGPYAITVDWGDGKPVDLISRQFPGTFDIQHVYDSPGVYNIVVKAVDNNGGVAYLQLVGVANGPLSQDTGSTTGDDGGPQQVKILWQPAAMLIPLIFTTFWLGKRYELKVIRKRLEHGERPF
jgi:hypothetical protein